MVAFSLKMKLSDSGKVLSNDGIAVSWRDRVHMMPGCQAQCSKGRNLITALLNCSLCESHANMAQGFRCQLATAPPSIWPAALRPQKLVFSAYKVDCLCFVLLAAAVHMRWHACCRVNKDRQEHYASAARCKHVPICVLVSCLLTPHMPTCMHMRFRKQAMTHFQISTCGQASQQFVQPCHGQ